ncbi:MAG: hypothetical protein ABJP45_06150 [Cyclobacteriaceae bacterium]
MDEIFDICSMIWKWFVVALLLTGCKFNSDKEFFKEITPREIGKVSISLDEMSGDSILIYKDTNFEVEIGNAGTEVESVSIQIDGIEVDSYADFDGFFTLDTQDLSEGAHRLTIRIAGNENNNSLADELGVSFSVWRNWILTYDPTPSAVSIKSVVIDDGRLKVSWEMPEILNFDYFVLEETTKGKSITIEKEETSIDYEEFIAGTAKFRMDLLTDGSRVATGQEVAFVHIQEQFIDMQIRDSNDVYLVINRPDLYGNVNTITVGNTNYDFGSETLELLLDQDIQFGQRPSYSIFLNPANYRTHVSGVIGTELPAVNLAHYDATNDVYFVRSVFQGNDSIALYMLNSYLTVLDTLIIRSSAIGEQVFSVSENGQWLVYMPRSGGILYHIDPISFEVVKKIDLRVLLGSSTLWNFGLNVANNGFVLLRLLRPESHVVLDLNDLSIKATSPGNDFFGNDGDISPSGSYLFMQGDMHELVGSNYEYRYTLDATNKVAFFLEEGKLIHMTETDANIINVVTGTSSTSFSFENHSKVLEAGVAAYLLDFDKTSKVINSTLARNKYQIYDYDGVLLKEVILPSSVSFSFKNGYLFSSVGQAARF